METTKNRVALIGIIVEDLSATERINQLLHQYSDYIVGRQGIPYRTKGISVISIILDAPSAEISALSGKLGMIAGINVKTMYAKVNSHE